MQNDQFLEKGIDVFHLERPTLFANMPIIVGKLFIELPELYERIHYQPPFVNTPFILLVEAYGNLMKHYLADEHGKTFNFTLALESYKYLVLFKRTLKSMQADFDITPYENLIVKETLKRFPNFTLDEEKYKDLLEFKQNRVIADKEVLDVNVLLKYIEENFSKLNS